MSAALAAARKRRAPASATPEPAPQQVQSQQPAGGLTLPQVIAVIDTRLVTLEKFMKSQQDNTVKPSENISIAPSTGELDDIVNEFNSRYAILAEEIENIKNIVLNLQSYTMNVNKTLLEERVHVLSEITPTSMKLDTTEQLEQIREFDISEINGI